MMKLVGRLITLVGPLLLAPSLLGAVEPPTENTVQPTSVDPLLRATPITRARSMPLEEGPNVNTAPGTTTVLMHFYGAKGHPIVWLRIPQQYVRAPSERVQNSIDLAFWVTYPDLKGAFADGNEGLFGCVGYCRGRMMIELMNRSGVLKDAGATLSLMMNFKHCITDSSPGNTGFKRAEHCAGGPKFPQMAEDFYIEEGAQGGVEGFVICQPLTPNPMCEEWMRLPKNENVEVHYRFSLRDLPHWPALRLSVANLVDSFVVKTLPPKPA